MCNLRLRSGRKGNIIPLVAIIGAIVALIGAWFLYQSTSDSTKKMENANITVNRNAVINTNTILNANTSINTNTSVNVNTAVNINVVVNTNTAADAKKVLIVTSPENGKSYSSVMVAGTTKPNYELYVFGSGSEQPTGCFTKNTFASGGAGKADTQGKFSFPINYLVTESIGNKSIVVVAVENLSKIDSCIPNDNLSNVINFTLTNPTAGWKTYTNGDLGFSFKYPTSFTDFVATSQGMGYRGTSVASSGSTTSGDGASITISAKDMVYDPTHIEGLYGPITAKDLTMVKVGIHNGSMYLDGDAGCGAQEVLASIGTNRTLWLSFGDCADTNMPPPLYNQKDLINQILSTFTFTK